MARGAIDLDSTVADFSSAMLRRIFERSGRRYTINDWTSFNCEDWLDPDHTPHFREAMDDPQFWDAFRLLPGARQGLELLAGDGHDLVVVTAKPDSVHEITRNWVRKKRLPVTGVEIITKSRLKPDFIINNGFDFVLDDNQDTARACRDAGMLVGMLAWPWNNEEPGIVRARSWQNLSKIISFLLGAA